MNLYYLQIDAKKFWGGGLGALTIILSLTLSLWWWKEEKQAFEKNLTSPARVADQRVEGFTWQELKAGQKQFEIIADLAEVFNKEQIAVLKQVDHPVQARTYYNKGPVTMFAREIIYNLITKDTEARGDVLVVTSEGATLRTQSLLWKNDLARLQTTDPVTLDKEGLHLTGVGMVADTQLQHVSLGTSGGRIQTTFQGAGQQILPQRKQP